MYYKDGTPAHDSITIRRSRPEDEAALRRLAGLDSATLPEGPMMLAFVGDELRAAISGDGRDAIADPFHSTAELVRLLSERVSQANASNGGPRRGLRGMLRDRARYAAS